MSDFPQPEAVFRYFSALAAIPHGSGNTQQIRQWALDTAKSLHLEAYADAAGNVIIKKDASAGYEDHPRVILQGHMDMVCAKLPDCPKNMDTEGLDLLWDDEFLRADGTTLGGDDGIAIAYAFAVLESGSVPHPPLTVLFTVDEETGMDGAAALSPDALAGTYLINIDSEEEGIFTVGCAGGVRVHMQYPAETEAASGVCLRIAVSGLTGGHSGAEIHKPLLNANVVMTELLSAVNVPVRLAAWEGGVRDNVIPTECEVRLYCREQDASAAEQAIREEAARIRLASPQETGFAVSAAECSPSDETALTVQSSAALLTALRQLPNGVQKMNEALHMPETSLNLGIFSLKGNCMYADALLRSGINAEKAALAARLHGAVQAAGGTSSESGSYPAWEYIPGTALEHTAAAVYEALCGRKPVIQTIHAGLECGILSAKAPQLQCISIGPDLLDIHTPRERLSIPSAARTWEFLLALLKAL